MSELDLGAASGSEEPRASVSMAHAVFLPNEPDSFEKWLISGLSQEVYKMACTSFCARKQEVLTE